jgi:hypothetical protein
LIEVIHAVERGKWEKEIRYTAADALKQWVARSNPKSASPMSRINTPARDFVHYIIICKMSGKGVNESEKVKSCTELQAKVA